MTQVFLSYSRANESRIKALAGRLRAWGYEVWLDQQELRARETWRESVAGAIEASEFFLIGVSKSSVTSDFVKWELELAEEAGTTIIPMVFSSPSSESWLTLRLDHLQHISFAPQPGGSGCAGRRPDPNAACARLEGTFQEIPWASD